MELTKYSNIQAEANLAGALETLRGKHDKIAVVSPVTKWQMHNRILLFRSANAESQGSDAGTRLLCGVISNVISSDDAAGAQLANHRAVFRQVGRRPPV